MATALETLTGVLLVTAMDTATATLSFNVTGSVAVGGTFVVVLPSESMVGCDSTWSMPAAPTVLVSSPELVLAAGTWASGTQTLEITTARSMIEEGARVEMLVYNVRTPSCLYDDTSVTNVTSFDSAAHVIDDKTSIAIANVSIGSLGGDLSWTTLATVAAVMGFQILFHTPPRLQSQGAHGQHIP